MRIDLYLTQNNFAVSRERAKSLIKSGCVKINGLICQKPAAEIAENDFVEVSSKIAYVGRGYLKLETAFQAFELDIHNKICADIGASTGGFTQYMLCQGAELVYAIDVGHGQLSQSLLSNSKVVNCEGVNARYLTRDFFNLVPQFMSVDLSFISLKIVLPALIDCLSDSGEFVLLIKPQFEAGKASLNKKGVVKNKKDHIRVLDDLFVFFTDMGLTLLNAAPSSVMGGDGNIEYLVHLKKLNDKSAIFNNGISSKLLVDKAFSLFEK